MRLLRVFHLAVVKPGLVWHVLAAVQLPGLAASGVQRLLRQRGGVGSHVGDVAVLVEGLCDPHGPLGTPPKATGGFLLKRRGHERCLRLSGRRLLRHRVDREGLSSERRRQGLGRSLVQVYGPLSGQSPVVVEVRPRCDPRPTDCRQPPWERAGKKLRVDAPILHRRESDALSLAVHHEANGYRLDTSCRFCFAPNLLPQDLGYRVAIQPVNNAAGFLRLHQAHVEFPWTVDSFPDRFRGDLVENHSLDRDFGLEDFE